MFLDETGRLPVARDRFFAVGLLKCPEPAVIQRPMQRLRDQKEFRVELKWSEVRKNILPIYRQALGCFFSCAEAKFACYVTDKTVNDPIARYGNQWRAYERLAAQLIVGNVKKGEIVTVLADEYSTPPTERFEENLRNLVHKRLQPNEAICGVCRMRSDGVDLFQILDVLLGAVAYDYKVQAGLIDTENPKGRLLNFIKDRFGVATFTGGHKGPRLNVHEFGRATAIQRAFAEALKNK